MYEHFKKGSEFFSYPEQSNQAVTAMHNLYRASQVAFPGEKILGDAEEFATKFLREKQASNEVLDKWIITKDLPGEVYMSTVYIHIYDPSTHMDGPYRSSCSIEYCDYK